MQDLHSYVDLTAESVISVATAYEAPTSLAGAIKLLEVQFQSYLRFLRSSRSATTLGNYRNILALDTPLNDF